MKSDKIFKDIIEVLQNNNDHHLDQLEMEKLAAVICAVVKSSKDVREFFYLGVTQIAYDIQDLLKIKEKEILKRIEESNDDDKILN